MLTAGLCAKSSGCIQSEETAAAPGSSCCATTPKGGLSFSMITQRAGSMPEACLGNVTYNTADHTAYFSQLCNQYNDVTSEQRRFLLETWVVPVSGELSEFTSITWVAPDASTGNTTCHMDSGGHVVYPEQWCSDPYHQTYYRGPMTLASLELEQWEYPGSSGRPIFWVDKSAGPLGCRPVASIKGHPGSLDPTYIADGYTISQTFANLTVSDDPVTIPPLSKACGGPGGGANDAEAAAVVARWRNDGLPSALAAAGLKLRAKAAVA